MCLMLRRAGPCILVDVDPYVGGSWLLLTGCPLHDYHSTLAISYQLHNHSLMMIQHFVEERTVGLRVAGFSVVYLLEPLDRNLEQLGTTICCRCLDTVEALLSALARNSGQALQTVICTYSVFFTFFVHFSTNSVLYSCPIPVNVYQIQEPLYSFHTSQHSDYRLAAYQYFLECFLRKLRCHLSCISSSFLNILSLFPVSSLPWDC